jgi:hypothetical protein
MIFAISVAFVPSYKSVIQTKGSNGVFKARYLNAYFNPNSHYDDIGICNAVGVYKTTDSTVQKEEELLSGNNTKKTILFKLYPNPTNGFVYIEYELKQTDVAMLQIIDLLGNEISTFNIDCNKRKMKIFLPEITTGIYIARFVVNNKNIEIQKLIIE